MAISKYDLWAASQLERAKTLRSNDPHWAKQFRTKQDAVRAAKAIGWLAKDATRIDVMGFLMWAIADDHRVFLTDAGYSALLQAR